MHVELNLLTPLTKAINRYSLDPSVRRALEVAKILWNWGDAVSSKLETELTDQGYMADCSEGCSYCCHQNVQITPYEIIGIADWSRKHLGQVVIQEIQRRAQNISVQMKNDRHDADRWRRRDPCPCLDEDSGRCLIYAVRPLYCRTSLSVSRESCRQCYSDASTDILDIPVPVNIALPNIPSTEELDGFPKYVGIAVAEASVKYWHAMALAKMPGKYQRAVTTDVIDRVVSTQTLELTKSISFAFSGDIDRNLKSLVRLKESEISACYKLTEPE